MTARMTPRVPAVVVGVGGIGSAVLYHLARRGIPALGLDRFRIPHDRGSSHGHSRIFRVAYFEHPDYVPLAVRALELWQGLERESGERLFVRTGGIDGGAEDGGIFQGALGACRMHDLDHEVLDGAGLRARFPGLRVPREDRFVLQSDAGVLVPERCIEAHVRMAEALGAELRSGVRVIGWDPEGAGARVHLDDGTSLRTDHLVLTPGPWAAGVLAGVPGACGPPPTLEVERQVVAWFAPDDPAPFAAGALPVFNVEMGGGHYYGMPGLDGRGPKVGRFGHLHERVDADTVSREVTRADVELLQGWADHYLNGAGAVAETGTCLFTHTRDGHFVVDTLPGLGVTVAVGFSGHGFKFASALGEALAARVVGAPPPVPDAHLAWGRPGLTGGDGSDT